MNTMNNKTKNITRIGILAAISIVLYAIEFPVIPGIEHLKIDPSLIPAVIGGILVNPFAGVLIELVKNVLHLFRTSSAGIGELINFLVGTSVILPVAFIYRKKPSTKSFLIGAVCAFVSILTIGALCNYIFTAPYMAVLGRPEPTQAEVMAFVTASFALNAFKVFVTLVPTFFILPILKKNL